MLPRLDNHQYLSTAERYHRRRWDLRLRSCGPRRRLALGAVRQKQKHETRPPTLCLPFEQLAYWRVGGHGLSGRPVCLLLSFRCEKLLQYSATGGVAGSANDAADRRPQRRPPAGSREPRVIIIRGYKLRIDGYA